MGLDAPLGRRHPAPQGCAPPIPQHHAPANVGNAVNGKYYETAP
jgi:hypothetical protein